MKDRLRSATTAMMLSLFIAAPLRSQTVSDTSFTTSTGERVLQQEIIVDATLEEVWKSWTTSEGLRTFVAPVIAVEIKTGGDWFANYKLGAKVGDSGTIHNTVLNYLPMEMLSIKIGLTDIFPKELRDADTLFSVLTFKDLGHNKVKVIESIVGWKSGPDWDKTYEFFRRGDAMTLKAFSWRLQHGPIDWTKKNPYEGFGD
jgi:uncharacterized protein YndB with AHSA1/START domain